MRRLAAIGVVLLASLVALIAFGNSRASAGSSFTVDAIFDTAKGIIPGQLVKIAGARVGTVTNVSLTSDFKARIEMSVDRRFAPFRTDASCSIKPEGLIAENFVECDPGTPAAPEVHPSAHHAPTVGVQRNSEPVAITDLFNIWNTPTRDRLRVLINELGGGFAGRGEDLNFVLHRANPALAVARRAIAIVNRQRVQLERIIANSDPVVAELARRSPAVKRFIDGAASVTQTTADHRSKLADAVRRLPGLLSAARPALQQLNVVVAAGAPVLSDLRSSAHGVNRLLRDVHPFTAAAVPALVKIGPALGQADTAIRNAAPIVAQLRGFVQHADPVAQLLNRLVLNVRSRGVAESLLTFVYNATAASARFDSISHLIPSHLLISPCANYSTQPVAGCSAFFGTLRADRVHARPAAAQPPRAGGARSGQPPAAAPAPRAAPAPGNPAALAGGPAALGSAAAPTPPIQQVAKTIGSVPAPATPSAKTVQPLLDYLLK